MTEYTPTTDEVRGDYANFQVPAGGGDFRAEYAEGLAEFDRWLAAHDAEVRAGVVPEEPEVEWEYEYADDDDPDGHVYGRVRRIVGPWGPVEQGGE